MASKVKKTELEFLADMLDEVSLEDLSVYIKIVKSFESDVKHLEQEKNDLVSKIDETKSQIKNLNDEMNNKNKDLSDFILDIKKSIENWIVQFESKRDSTISEISDELNKKIDVKTKDFNKILEKLDKDMGGKIKVMDDKYNDFKQETLQLFLDENAKLNRNLMDNIEESKKFWKKLKNDSNVFKKEVEESLSDVQWNIKKLDKSFKEAVKSLRNEIRGIYDKKIRNVWIVIVLSLFLSIVSIILNIVK